jgi:hypothetical protein
MRVWSHGNSQRQSCPTLSMFLSGSDGKPNILARAFRTDLDSSELKQLQSEISATGSEELRRGTAAASISTGIIFPCAKISCRPCL